MLETAGLLRSFQPWTYQAAVGLRCALSVSEVTDPAIGLIQSCRTPPPQSSRLVTHTNDYTTLSGVHPNSDSRRRRYGASISWGHLT